MCTPRRCIACGFLCNRACRQSIQGRTAFVLFVWTWLQVERREGSCCCGTAGRMYGSGGSGGGGGGGRDEPTAVRLYVGGHGGGRENGTEIRKEAGEAATVAVVVLTVWQVRRPQGEPGCGCWLGRWRRGTGRPGRQHEVEEQVGAAQ